MGNEAIIKELDGIKAELLTEVRSQQEHIDKVGKQSTDLAQSITELNARYDEVNGKLQSTTETLEKIDARMGRMGNSEQVRSAGQQFMEALADWNGDIRATPVVKIERRDLFQAGSLGDTGAYLWQPQRLDPVYPQRPTSHIRDLLNVQQAQSATLEYIRRAGPLLVAGIQDETISSETGKQGKKKEQSISFSHEVASPYTVAHYVPITKQSVKDAPFITNMIEGELSLGLRLKEDIDLLYGSGVGTLEGLMVDSDVPENDSEPGQSMADTIRRARTDLMVKFFSPTGVVLNPYDFEEIEISKDNEGRYLFFFGPDGLGGNSLWRVPVIETAAMQQGDYLMGDFNIGATLFDWEAPTITYGYVDDDFVRNQLVILGEERIIFAVQRPTAFVRGTFDTQSS